MLSFMLLHHVAEMQMSMLSTPSITTTYSTCNFFPRYWFLSPDISWPGFLQWSFPNLLQFRTDVALGEAACRISTRIGRW